MEKAKRRVRICLIFVVMLAVIMGFFYYYNALDDETLEGEGTLITAVHSGWDSLCQ